MGILMTTKPASVTKLRGHIHVGRYSLRSLFGTSSYYLAPTICESNSVQEYVRGLGYINFGCKKFFCARGIVYYMDGNCNVWETDIAVTGNVKFNPVCVENGRVINFRLLHKLEWLFS